MSNNEMLENPTELLKNLQELFLVEHDVKSLEKIDTSINRLTELTKEKLNSNHIEISKQTSVLDKGNIDISALRDQLERAQDESDQYKSANAMETKIQELERLEAEVKRIREDLNEKVSTLVKLDKEIANEVNFDDKSSMNSDDPITKANILKLKLYRSMGVIVDSVNNQILINQENGEIDILPIENEYSDYFVTKHIWSKIKNRK
ncbi:hypothetical protein TPHA_0G02820 [Tetrapisispora phaffii CBS 4417]|uniref:Kinetochore protein Spc24 n=1 Tax=Tetrapisispora phaffii (strain ATCC 24235 / CBS 4417 / NBRC 1672 / NRRL Y-8282 / UCD 70-5) TaxID=1071381 RepID=G8BW42_TETPH|nr:hypothetical protein TPHA_0G02820 [Tetrapisispora phaffii CBS 4417]CCE64120.1 hypothetical protein TPHA_0G02820 [Tetrapisispora phaffii CBS 4417]